MQAQIKRMNEVGDTVFLTPTPLLSYEELVLKSLGSNTYRGFHRKNNNCLVAPHTFRDVLTEKKDYLIHALNNLTSGKQLNKLAISYWSTKPVFDHLSSLLHTEYDSFDVNLDKLLAKKTMLRDAVVKPEVVTDIDQTNFKNFDLI